MKVPIRAISRASLVLLGSLFAIAVVGSIYQGLSEAKDKQNFPAPGLLLEVDGSLMHIHCQGDGSPTVVVEQGLGGFSSAWDHIHDDIADKTRVCAYDRVGMGYSEPIGRALSSTEVSMRLYKLLATAGETDDLVLVGWSAGGVYVREFQRKYPDLVRGMVFVDSSHENQLTRLPTRSSGGQSNRRTLMEVAKYIAPLGILRISGLIENEVNSLPISESLRNKVLAQYHFSHAAQAQLHEAEAFQADLKNPPQMVSLGDLPLAVITRGAPIQSSAGDETVRFLEERERIWVELQKELASLSSNSTHIFATQSRHSIHHDEPNLLVDTIFEIVDRSRSELDKTR